MHHYMVPTGFTFTRVSTLREAKRLARQNGPGSQWFEKFTRTTNNVPGIVAPYGKERFTFSYRNGRMKWH